MRKTAATMGGLLASVLILGGTSGALARDINQRVAKLEEGLEKNKAQTEWNKPFFSARDGGLWRGRDVISTEILFTI